MGVTPTEPKDPVDQIAELCPTLMALGMTYEEYWNGDNEAPKYYLKADELRKERQNEWMWMQGKYVYDAIGALIPAFKFGVKHPKAEPYNAEPYPITRAEVEDKKRRKYEGMLSKMKVKTEQSKKWQKSTD